MTESITRRRPWLAAVLGVLVTGAGHVYLRRWRRALGWLALLFGVSTLLVDPEALEALAAGDAIDLVELAPTLLVGGLSVVDAYFVTRAQNRREEASSAPSTEAGDNDTVYCPNCGKELDTDLDFCQWCTTPLDDLWDARQSEPDQTDDEGPDGW